MDTSAGEQDLIRRALESLAPLGIHARVLRRPDGADTGIDASSVELSRAGRTGTFSVVTRRTIRPATVTSVVDQTRRGAHPTLLVSEHISVETAELLRRRGIQFIDAAGNAYIDTPDLLIAITGRRPAHVPKLGSRDRIGPAVLQVMFVLLRDHEAAGLSVRALGERAGVSHGAAATALHVFDKRGWTRHAGPDGYRLVDPDGMLAAWLPGFTDQLSPKLELARATFPGAVTPGAWARSVLGHFSAAHGLLGGEGAAEVSGHNIRGSTASVYVRTWDATTMKQLRLVPAHDGAISVRSAFAPHIEDPADPRLVDPLVVLGEIASIPDERLDETRAGLRAAVAARFVR